MMEWIKEHPYLTGAAVLVAIIGVIVLRSSSSSAPSAGITADPNTILAAGVANSQTQAQVTLGTNQLNAALEAAALQAQTAQLQALYGMQTTGQQTQAAVTVQSANDNAAVAVAQIQANTTVATTNANIGGAESIAGTQAGVQDEATQAALASQQDIDATSVAINSAQTAAAIQQSQMALTLGLNQSDNALILGQTQTAAQLAAIQNDNATALGINNTNAAAGVSIAAYQASSASHIADDTASVQQQALATYQSIYNTSTGAQETVDLAQISAAQENTQTVLQGINSGVYNKGGTGGANQVAAVTAVTGQGVGSSTAAEAAGAQENIASSFSAILNSAGNAAKGAATVVAAS